MPNRLIKFAQTRGLALSPAQADTLIQYAELVLAKKDFLNLTGAADQAEIVSRHLCDGLVCAAKIAAMAHVHKQEAFSVADAGAGAGFIGLTLAVSLPSARVTLIESIEKRCAFMNWAVLNLGLKNAKINKSRLGQRSAETFDFVTERAMGQLPDILGVCLAAVKPGGVFIAYQGENPQAAQTEPAKYGARLLAVEQYTLPDDGSKKKHLALFAKNE